MTVPVTFSDPKCAQIVKSSFHGVSSIILPGPHTHPRTPSLLARYLFIPVEESISMISTEDDSMSAAENIPVSEETYNQILDLRRPGETLDETLARLVEKVKKQRLTDDIEEVMARNEFVELDL